MKFFFERVKINDKYDYREEFPFVSPCGVEMNYIKCEELPIVLNKLITSNEAKNLQQFKKNSTNFQENDNGYLLYAGDQLFTVFKPSKLSVHPETGRLYHPCPNHLGGVALIASALASELSSHFHYSKNAASDDEVFI